jgi:hypothetical protein
MVKKTFLSTFFPFFSLVLVQVLNTKIGQNRRSKVELVLSYGSQFSEFIFIFSKSEF